jgi:Lysylphosphatidylglycerol synthase TM region
MGILQRLLRSRRARIAANVVFAAALLAVTLVSARHFLKTGWPLHNADPILVGAAIVLYLIAYVFKAWGWQRLFAEHERPGADALACAGGAACVGGIALPGRLDDALRVAVVKRFPGTRTGLGALGLSLIVLGMLDNAALTPMASVAAADAHSWAVRVGFAVVALAGVAAGFVVAFLPKLAAWHRLSRFRFARWVAEHTHCTREAWAAWVLISFSWALRGTAVFLLLNALAMGHATFPVALAFLCATAASAALPIAPAGAATQAGAGAAILIATGAPTTEAIAFSVAVQAMVIVTGAAVVLLITTWHLATRVRTRLVPARTVRASA